MLRKKSGVASLVVGTLRLKIGWREEMVTGMLALMQVLAVVGWARRVRVRVVRVVRRGERESPGEKEGFILKGEDGFVER